MSLSKAIRELLTSTLSSLPRQEEIYPFGPYTISSNKVFLLSPLSYAAVNLKPVVPGHCLVISRRKVHRMDELDPAEVSDLFRLVQAVGVLLQRRYSRRALTISVQDGEEAGQTVPHVHVHVLPRSSSDFKHNDEVYEALDKTNLAETKTKGPDCEDRPPRTNEEMEEEAKSLREFAEKLLKEQQ